MYSLGIAAFPLSFVIIKAIAKALVEKENLPKALFGLGRIIETFLGLRIKIRKVEPTETLIKGKTLVITKVILVKTIIKG